MYHTSLFRANTGAAVTYGQLNIVPFTADFVQNNTLFPDRDWQLVAAEAWGATLAAARVDAASLRQVSPFHIRPFVVGATPGNNPNFSQQLDRPARIRRAETVTVQVTNAAAEVDGVLLFLHDGNFAVPSGPFFRVYFTYATALNAGAWTLVTPAYESLIAEGSYECIGMEVNSATGLVARLAVPGATNSYRPGVPMVGTVGNRLPHYFYDHSFGSLGRFNTIAYPQLEIFATAADVTLAGWLDLVKIG